MSIRLEAIKPPPLILDPNKIRAGIDRELRDDAATVVNRMAHYPPQEPTDYVRTGNLGRSWKIEVKQPGEVWIVNRVVASVVRVRTKTRGVVTRRVRARAYAAYVQGPESTQAGIMAEKGWQRIDEVANEVFRRRRGVIVRILTGGNA